MAPKLAVESTRACCAVYGRSGSTIPVSSGSVPMSLALCRCIGCPAAAAAARAASRVDDMGSSDANIVASMSADGGSEKNLGKSTVLPTRVSRQPDGSPGSRLRYDTTRTPSWPPSLSLCLGSPNSSTMAPPWPTTVRALLSAKLIPEDTPGAKSTLEVDALGASEYVVIAPASLGSVVLCRPLRNRRLTRNHRRPKSVMQAMMTLTSARSTSTPTDNLPSDDVADVGELEFPDDNG